MSISTSQRGTQKQGLEIACKCQQHPCRQLSKRFPLQTYPFVGPVGLCDVCECVMYARVRVVHVQRPRPLSCELVSTRAKKVWGGVVWVFMCVVLCVCCVYAVSVLCSVGTPTPTPTLTLTLTLALDLLRARWYHQGSSRGRGVPGVGHVRPEWCRWERG